MAREAKFTIIPHHIPNRSLTNLLSSQAQADRVSSYQNRLDFKGLTILKSNKLLVDKPANTAAVSETVRHNLGEVPTVVMSANGGNGEFACPFTDVEISGADAGKIPLQISAVAITAFTFDIQILTPNYAANAFYAAELTFLIKYSLVRRDLPDTSDVLGNPF